MIADNQGESLLARSATSDLRRPFVVQMFYLYSVRVQYEVTCSIFISHRKCFVSCYRPGGIEMLWKA